MAKFDGSRRDRARSIGIQVAALANSELEGQGVELSRRKPELSGAATKDYHKLFS